MHKSAHSFHSSIERELHSHTTSSSGLIVAWRCSLPRGLPSAVVDRPRSRMPEGAFKPPQTPNPRSLLALQGQLSGGMFGERHCESLAMSSPENAAAFLALMQCTEDAREAIQSGKKQRGVQTRNLVCVCHAVCPDETQAWVSCFRGVSTAMKKKLPSSTNCEELRERLETCTQHASSRMLHAALIPAEKINPKL